MGLASGPAASENVFTPLGAEVIGWNASGGHFCFVSGCDETVFYVDPAAQPGQCVHPVARSFSDLLGLIIECRGTVPVCEAYHWSRLRFEETILKAQSGPKHAAVLRALRNGYQPPHIADPYGYIQQLQAQFDYTRLLFSEDYSEWSPIRPGDPEFPVFFGNHFAWEKKAYQAHPSRKTAELGKEKWHLPAVYACENGLIVDLFTQIDAGQIRAYLEKWPPDRTKELGKMGQMLRHAEDPFQCSIAARLNTPGGDFSPSVIRQWIWNPYLDNSDEVLPFLRQYQCSRESGWLFLRLSFPCKLRKKSPFKGFRLSLTREASVTPGECFETPEADGRIPFRNPINAQDHVLTIESCSQEELDPNFLYDGPRYYAQLEYFTAPALSPEELLICDCADSDTLHDLPGSEEPVLGSASISAEAPGNDVPWPEMEGAGIALSARHYVPAKTIRWIMLFRQKEGTSVTIPVL